MDETTQQNTAFMEQMSAASTSMSDKAGDLSNIVPRFQV